MSENFGLNEALSQANALTSQTAQHNALVRARNAGLENSLKDNLSKIEGQKKTAQAQQKIDQVLHGVESSFSSANALHAGYKQIGEIRQQGAGNYFSRQLAIGKSRVQRATGQTPDEIPLPQVKPKAPPATFAADGIKPAQPADPMRTGFSGTPAQEAPIRGSAAAPPVRDPQVEQPASTAGTAVKPSGATDAVKPSGATAPDTEGSKLLDGLGQAKGAIEGAQKIATIGTGTYDVFQDFKAKGIAGDNTADKISNVAGIVSGVADVGSIFLPFLAPVAAAAGAVAGISGEVGEEQDKDKKTDAVGKLTAQQQALTASTKKQEAANKMISSAGLQTQGFVASAQADNRSSIRPSSSF